MHLNPWGCYPFALDTHRLILGPAMQYDRDQPSDSEQRPSEPVISQREGLSKLPEHQKLAVSCVPARTLMSHPLSETVTHLPALVRPLPK